MANRSYTDLAPAILRQRLVVEGFPGISINDDTIKNYLSKLSEITQIKTLLQPVTHKSDIYGWAGWIHWEKSGAHFYAWHTPLQFFSVDIYTCKQFDPKLVIEFTRDFFQTTEITAKDFSSTPPKQSGTQIASTPPISYTLREPEIEVLSKRLLSEQPPKTKDAIILYRLEGTDELSNLGRHIERQVFFERFGNTESDMRRVYGKYERTSVFYVALNQTLCKPVGAMRIIRNSPAGMPTLRDVEKYAGISTETFQSYYGINSLDTVADVGTLAIPQEYRKYNEHHVVALIYRGAHLRLCYEGATHCIALVDSKLVKNFRMLGHPMWPLAGSKSFSYEGSDNTTALCGILIEYFPEVAKRLKNADPKLKPTLEYFSRRFIQGHEVDHCLMFDYAIWPGGSSPALKSASPKARL